VKVYDRAHLVEDLRQFVITDSMSRQLRKFFDAFTENLRSRIRGGKGGDGMAVWLWGFFGSGKSHVAKVLGHLLENDVVIPEGNRRAIDLFNVHLDDPSLPGAPDLKAALAEIRNHAWCKTIAFEIKSKLDQANPESVTEICLRSFYESLGLASTVWLARLERKLQIEGRYDAFLATYGAQNEREWITDRQEHGFYLDEITSALAVSLDRSIESAREMLSTYQRDHARVSPENFAREVTDYLSSHTAEVKPREPHLIFVIDEMGQFIGESGDRIHELQAIIEQAGNQGRGRIWFVCTSQEALDQVVDRTGLRLSALGKLDARFSTKIPLTGEDVRLVVQDRLLRKRESALPELNRLYSSKDGIIEDLCALRLERKLATVNQQNFAVAYPFLPYSIPLMQELFNAMRGFKLSGTERSMIGLAQGSLISLAEAQLGVLVPLDLIFDQVTDELSSADYLGTSGVRLIRESDARIPDTPVAPSRVLKALWLISRVEWVPRTPEVLAKLLADRIDTDLGKLRNDIQETLDRLQKAGLVGRDEATSQYRYLSEKERGIEEDIVGFIQDLGTGVGVAKRRAADLYKQRVLTRAKWNDFKIAYGKSGVIPFSVTLDDEVVTSAGEITIRISSSLANPKLDEIEQENLARGTKGRTIWWVAAEDKTLMDQLKRLEALEKIPQKPKWKNDRSDETLRVVKEKEKERAALEGHVAGLIEVSLKRGRLYYSGEVADLDGSKDLKSINADFVGAVAAHLYTRFPIADKAFDEKNIPAYLKAGTKNVNRLDQELGLFDAQGHLLRNSPIVETVFEELRRRKDESWDLTGKDLSEHFEKIPFGWPDALVRLVLAAMFRGGAVYLEPPDSDQPIYDLGGPGVEGLFTGPQKFKKTRFFPTTGGLTPSEVKEAKEALIALGESSVPDSAHLIAERVRLLGTRLVQDADKVRQRVEDLSLPLPDTYCRAESVTQSTTTFRDPVACVRKFIEDREDWKEIADFLSAYSQFVNNKRDASYRDYLAVIDYARACPAVFNAGDGIKEQLTELETIISAKEIMPKWKTVQEAALAVIDRYREVYRTAYETCEQAISNLKKEIENSEAFTRLDEARRKSVLNDSFGSGSALALTAIGSLNTAADLRRASERRKVSELDALRMAMPGYRTAIFDQCDREYIAQQEAASPKPKSGETEEVKISQPKLCRVNIRERVAGRRFVSKTEFESFWQNLGDEISAKFVDDTEVVVE
jgi:hypothetical protein